MHILWENERFFVKLNFLICFPGPPDSFHRIFDHTPKSVLFSLHAHARIRPFPTSRSNFKIKSTPCKVERRKRSALSNPAWDGGTEGLDSISQTRKGKENGGEKRKKVPRRKFQSGKAGKQEQSLFEKRWRRCSHKRIC